VVAVRDQRRRADLLADADAEDADKLVAEEADHGRDRDPANMCDRVGVDELLDRLVRGDTGGDEDDQDDHAAGDVLGLAVAVRQALARPVPRERKGDPEGDARRRVPEVVDRVGQERHRPGDEDDAQLQDGGDPEADERELERPDAPFTALQLVVGLVLDAVGMGERAAKPPDKPATVVVVVPVTAVAVAVARRLVRVLLGVCVLLHALPLLSCGGAHAMIGISPRGG
jgi:hypothetical protein